MKEKKQKSLIFAFSMVTVLILSSIGSFGISTDIVAEENTNQIANVNVKSNLVCIETSSNSLSNLNEISKNDKTHNLESLNFNLSENILVAGQDGNESYPSMVINGANSLVAYEYEDESDPYLYLSKSGNYSKTWSEPEKLEIELSGEEISVNSPALCIRPGKKHAYGIFFSSIKNSGIIGILDIPDISTFGNLDVKIWDWSEVHIPPQSPDFFSWWDFATPDIVYHDKPNVPWINGFIGSTNYSYQGDWSATDSIMFTFLDKDNPNALWIQWDHQLEDCSNIDLDMDDTSKTFYGVCEIKNASNQDLLFFKGIYNAVGQNITLTYDKEVFTRSENLTHPQILVEGEEIFIAAERDSKEIILFHSSNEGKDWTEKNVTTDVLPPGSNPKYPRLSANQTHLSCIFTEFGNISFINSTNQGLNWSEPVQLNTQNGSVVEEYRFADIIQRLDLTYVIWTDNRNGNRDLFLAKEGDVVIDLMIVPESVNITKDPDFPMFSTNNWINFTVRNNGDDYVENVPVEITYSKINNETVSTDYPAMILYLAGHGKEKSFQRPLFRMALIEFFRSLIDFAGIKNITIKIDPGDKLGDNDPTNDAFTLEDVSYEDIFPKLGWLEEILLRFA